MSIVRVIRWSLVLPLASVGAVVAWYFVASSDAAWWSWKSGEPFGWSEPSLSAHIIGGVCSGIAFVKAGRAVAPSDQPTVSTFLFYVFATIIVTLLAISVYSGDGMAAFYGVPAIFGGYMGTKESPRPDPPPTHD